MTEFFKLSLLAIEIDKEGESQIELYDEEENLISIFNEEINEVVLPIIHSYILLNLNINGSHYCSMKIPLDIYKFTQKKKYSHW